MFGRTHFTKIRFTGLNLEQNKDGILVDQIDYIQSIQPISSYRMDVQEEEGLNKSVFKPIKDSQVNKIGQQKTQDQICYLMCDI